MDINTITGVLLAGGLGSRMGGQDKGLLGLDGQVMATRILDRLRPQVGSLLINANRNLDLWQAYGLPVVSDEISGFSGPLAGMHAALNVCQTPWLVTVPCDSPFFPRDLVSRLAGQIGTADIAVVRSDGRLQPVFALLRRELRPGLESYLTNGGRKAGAWLASLALTAVDFDDNAAFANINTPEELVSASFPSASIV
jgi:molybdopterin-guanine dinucleotide biosynthesis protein A